MEESISCDWYDVSCGAGWAADELKLLVVWAYDGLLSGLATAFEAIPVPDFMVNLPVQSIPSSVIFVTNLFELPYGFSVVVTGITARFILRRIPGIG